MSDDQPFDPLLQQADRLPDFIKGSEGNDPSKHVRDAAEGDESHEEEEILDDGFGYQPPDPGTFTAD